MKKNCMSVVVGILGGIIAFICFFGFVMSAGSSPTNTKTAEDDVLTSTPLPTFDLPTESVGTCVVRMVSDDSSFELYVELVGDNSLLGCEYLVSNKYLDNTHIVEHLPNYPSTCSFYSSKISGSAYSNVPVVAQSFCDGANK